MTASTRAGRFRVRTVLVVLVAYVLFVIAVTMWPTPVDRSLDRYLDTVLVHLHAHGVPAFVNYAFVEFTANIAFFVPLGFFAVLLPGRRWWWVGLLLCVLLSCSIEFVQGEFLPGRVASIWDVVANSSGAVVGAVAGVALRGFIGHRDRLLYDDWADRARISPEHERVW